MNKVISNFWTAVIASIILTVTALLLEGNLHLGKILIMEGALFGVRVGDQVVKAYQVSKTNPERMKL